MFCISKEFLIEELIVNKKTITLVARELGISKHVIYDRISEYGLIIKEKTRANDLIGQRFSRLVVKSRGENDKFGKSKWLCICDCGKEVVLNGSSLTRGLTESCGCLKRELCFKGYKDISGAFWNKLIKSAGEREIDFALSIEDAWDLFVKQNGKCALSGLELTLCSNNDNSESRCGSIDRIDSNKGYTIDNIQWVHKAINMMKIALPDSDFVYLCNCVSEFSGHKAVKIENISTYVSFRKKKQNEVVI